MIERKTSFPIENISGQAQQIIIGNYVPRIINGLEAQNCTMAVTTRFPLVRAGSSTRRSSMGKVEFGFAKGKSIYVGIDVHKKDWVVTVLCQGEEAYHATMGTEPGVLIKLLNRFEASEVHTVYEAGPTGYWLHDALEASGINSS